MRIPTVALFSAMFLLPVVSGDAVGLTWALGPSDIYGVGGLDVTIPGSEFDVFSAITDPFGGSISFTGDVQHFIVGSSWSTWSHGYVGSIFSPANSASSIRLDFDEPVTAFGFYAQPNVQDWFDITLGLSDGSADTKNIHGLAGAEFFGFYDASVDWLEINSNPSAEGFAFGEMVMARDVGAVPEPGTMMLLGSGLLGFALFRKRN